MTKLYMRPRVADFGDEESGIRRVVEAYEKYLPKYGYVFVDDPNDADLTIGHVGNIEKPDVLVIHGLYWTADYGTAAPKWEYNVNREIIQSARYARQITVTSRWVQEVFARDMRIKPAIVPHGIEWEDWQQPVPAPESLYVLWNKNRSGIDVCSTDDMERLASMSPSVLFLSTFATNRAPANVRKIGLQPHSEMSKYVRGAAVYLATVKETFGIGILEAMAAGVPVLGWHGGGIEDLVEHGVNGYLVSRGDYVGLKEGLAYCMEHRKSLGENGRQKAREFTWSQSVQKLHHVLQSALVRMPPSVSVVIPCYNYGNKVERAIESALNQSLPPGEIIVVDDGSDEQHAAMTKTVSERLGAKYIRKDNGGVATARNVGIQAASGKYICPLDADDAIAPTFLERCVIALEGDRSLSIAYTGLMAIRPDGSGTPSQWPGEYNFDRFLKRQNQVPTCCVFRREMWQRIGGYNQRYAPTGAGAEDAEFFLRAGAYGFRAEKVTGESLFLYSIGTGHTSKGGYTEVDWTALHPWTKDNKHPFASLATPANGFSHPVRQYDEPTISVVIPVGPGHEEKLRDALDSLESQSFRKWEAVVVFDNWDGDTGKIAQLETFLSEIEMAYPYARIKVNKDPHKGAGWARNRGVEMSRAPLILFLDSDDWLYPNALSTMYNTWVTTGGIVYSDYVGKAFVSEDLARSSNAAGKLLSYSAQTGEAVLSHRSAEYDCFRAQRQPDPSDMYIWNLISSLIPKAYHNMIGGFDENMESWEDWDYWIRIAKSGICFYRIAEPLIVYRFYTGNRREAGLQQYPHLIQYLQEKYKRSENVACTSCGSKNAPNPNPSVPAAPVTQQVNAMADSDFILVSYDHPNIGQHRVIGAVTKTIYGYRGGGDQFYVHKDDIAAQPDIFHPIHRTEDLISSTPVPPPPPPPPEPKIVVAEPDEGDLQRIPGISDYVARGLNAEGVYTVSDLQKFPRERLTTIDGIGKGRAASIIEFLDNLEKR